MNVVILNVKTQIAAINQGCVSCVPVDVSGMCCRVLPLTAGAHVRRQILEQDNFVEKQVSVFLGARAVGGVGFGARPRRVPINSTIVPL